MSESDNNNNRNNGRPKKRGNPATGYILIVMALGLFWLGSHLRAPLDAQHKFLVAEEGIDPRFQNAVIFILQHNVAGAYGVIVNRPPAGDSAFSEGGPVETDKIAGLYTADIALPGAIELGGTGLAYIEGDGVQALQEADPKPQWYIITRGYAGWGPKQLDGEIRRKGWKVIDYTGDLLLDVAPENMWKEAQKYADTGGKPPIAQDEPKNKRGI